MSDIPQEAQELISRFNAEEAKKEEARRLTRVVKKRLELLRQPTKRMTTKEIIRYGQDRGLILAMRGGKHPLNLVHPENDKIRCTVPYSSGRSALAFGTHNNILDFIHKHTSKV